MDVDMPAAASKWDECNSQVDSVMESSFPEVNDIPTIQELFTSYAVSFPGPSKIGTNGFNYAKYFDPDRLTKTRENHSQRLEKARTLAVALLKHYYPAQQGYRVKPINFPLTHLGGWRTWVYPKDCYTAARRKSQTMVGGLRKNPSPVYDAWDGDIKVDKFHRILPEHITGYVVLNEVQYEDGTTGWAQHTYLAIMMDDLDTFEHWVPEALMQPDRNFVSMPRADILNDALGRQAGLARGYAIIMLGPRFEFYDYHAKPAWVEKPWEHYLTTDGEDGADVDGNPASEEEISCFSHLGGSDVDSFTWAVDIRKPNASVVVDALFKSVASRDVEYRDGYTLPGPEV